MSALDEVIYSHYITAKVKADELHEKMAEDARLELIQFRAEIASLREELDGWHKFGDTIKRQFDEAIDCMASAESALEEAKSLLAAFPPIHANPDQPIAQWITAASKWLALHP